MHEGHRERLISKLIEGSTILSDHEILEILLFYTIPRKNTNEQAHLLLDNFGSLKGCFNADYSALVAIQGIGHKTASFIVTLGEIFRRMEEDKHQLPTIFSYDACKQILIDSFKHLNEEKFVALFLNKSGEIILRKIFSPVLTSRERQLRGPGRDVSGNSHCSFRFQHALSFTLLPRGGC